jgi:ATP phosphoribosyltransferase regulatory subunit
MRQETPVPSDVAAAIRAPLQAAGAMAIEPPVLQPLSLLLDLAGETLRERLFVLQAEGGEELCLRPDFTTAAVLAHIASGRPGGRYLCDGSVFQVSVPGTDEPDEFREVGLESFNAADIPLADAENAALAWRAATAGGREDLRIVFGDTGLFFAFIDALGLAEPLAARLKRAASQPRRLRAELEGAGAPAASTAGSHRLEALLTQLPEAEAAGMLEELWRLAGIQPVGGRPAGEIVQRLSERSRMARAPALTVDQATVIERYLAISAAPDAALQAMTLLVGGGAKGFAAAAKAWSVRLKALEDEGIDTDKTTLSAGFSRPFGYYDGVFFEIVSEALGRDRPVAAGGRYDGLPSRLGAEKVTGAVGCMVRPARAWAGARA